MPQFANTKQRVAYVVVELESGKPVRIREATGSFLDFDAKGQAHESFVRGGFEAMETYDALERSKRIRPRLNPERVLPVASGAKRATSRNSAALTCITSL
jgi:hypothetical protein